MKKLKKQKLNIIIRKKRNIKDLSARRLSRKTYAWGEASNEKN